MKVEKDHPTLLTKLLNKQFLKFVISGGINTLFTYLVYLLLLQVLSYSMSYTISYISGIFLSYYLNTIFVFKEKVTFRKFLKFPVVYLVQYLINLLMLFVLVEYLNLSKQIVPLIVIVVTIPITYTLSKLIIKSK
ncbi:MULTISPECIES: GtrA family protein [Paenibacillus]|jgi:putative flippase GtrA|uniref:Polysaccharide synthesis protein GtrA n=1 Tax=Paenibacillus odorifer TaxID=189426 RepID=A0AB36J8P3_9BACL|nr:GtrA family protein [Paenibacillus odorifer]OMD12204.1 polysaccharide synthesis protein GtrA [Paenibacillus odorifer]OMD25552.1 polysaccharide synthesis protein GtrA [Paenibacillus odorifer]OME08941.1 polysaccharide synthesis protein GtrA [Paenibacillus odorifer]OME15064.1 polysaccharide synthesis protein GtrA [Paenibacillus odorifer]OME47757.1 polysaccharide synthesis protein GtrA [Paenibacillus odorifer]